MGDETYIYQYNWDPLADLNDFYVQSYVLIHALHEKHKTMSILGQNQGQRLSSMSLQSQIGKIRELVCNIDCSQRGSHCIF